MKFTIFRIPKVTNQINQAINALIQHYYSTFVFGKGKAVIGVGLQQWGVWVDVLIVAQIGLNDVLHHQTLLVCCSIAGQARTLESSPRPIWSWSSVSHRENTRRLLWWGKRLKLLLIVAAVAWWQKLLILTAQCSRMIFIISWGSLWCSFLENRLLRYVISCSDCLDNLILHAADSIIWC